MSIDQLRDAYMAHVDNEPPKDAGLHPSMELQEQVGNAWARWERTRQTLWTMLGDALVKDCIGENDEETIVIEW